MSRVLVNLHEAQVQALSVLMKAEHRPRAAMIRDAIDAYIAQRMPALCADVFGVWKEKEAVEGVTYQEALRAQW